MLVITCILSFVFSFMLVFFLRKIAIKKAILDIPNHRSSHTAPTPRGGGLAIAIVWYSTLIILFALGEIQKPLFFALISGIILSVVSFIDDLKNLSPGVRFISQFISACGAIFALDGVQFIDLGFYTLNSPILLSLIAILVIIWFINLFNFLDGLDGYLGVETVFVFLSLFIFSGQNFLLIMVAATVGFLFWNWPKAKIFCGDIGSTLIGFNVAVVSLWLQSSEHISLIIPLVLTALFWGDATYTLIRRILNKEQISQAHRKHAYQRLHQSGFNHLQVLLIGFGFNILLFVLSGLFFMKIINAWVVLGAMVLFLFLFLGFSNKRKPFDKQ